jgi:mono/diheme cytochrome c family protein
VINGVTKMPVFAGVIAQEGLWAIRSYIEAKHEEEAALDAPAPLCF